MIGEQEIVNSDRFILFPLSAPENVPIHISIGIKSVRQVANVSTQQLTPTLKLKPFTQVKVSHYVAIFCGCRPAASRSR